jgi:hypothetical protein
MSNHQTALAAAKTAGRTEGPGGPHALKRTRRVTPAAIFRTLVAAVAPRRIVIKPPRLHADPAACRVGTDVGTRRAGAASRRTYVGGRRRALVASIYIDRSHAGAASFIDSGRRRRPRG